MQDPSLDFNISVQNNSSSTGNANINSNSLPSAAPQQPKPQTDNVDFTNFLAHASNPGIVFFTLIFKVSAIAIFLLLSIFSVSDALTFILVVICSAFDFWFVKNVSGRIIVGLRWWNEVKDDGSEIWIFESENEKRDKNVDTTIFWGSLYAAPLFWAIFTVLEIIGLKLMWFLVCVIAFVLTGSNAYGYYKCSKEQQKKFSSFANEKTKAGLGKILQYGLGMNGQKS